MIVYLILLAKHILIPLQRCLWQQKSTHNIIQNQMLLSLCTSLQSQTCSAIAVVLQHLKFWYHHSSSIYLQLFDVPPPRAIIKSTDFLHQKYMEILSEICIGIKVAICIFADWNFIPVTFMSLYKKHSETPFVLVFFHEDHKLCWTLEVTLIPHFFLNIDWIAVLVATCSATFWCLSMVTWFLSKWKQLQYPRTQLLGPVNILSLLNYQQLLLRSRLDSFKLVGIYVTAGYICASKCQGPSWIEHWWSLRW